MVVYHYYWLFMIIHYLVWIITRVYLERKIFFWNNVCFVNLSRSAKGTRTIHGPSSRIDCLSPSFDILAIWFPLREISRHLRSHASTPTGNLPIKSCFWLHYWFAIYFIDDLFSDKSTVQSTVDLILPNQSLIYVMIYDLFYRWFICYEINRWLDRLFMPQNQDNDFTDDYSTMKKIFTVKSKSEI